MYTQFNQGVFRHSTPATLAGPTLHDRATKVHCPKTLVVGVILYCVKPPVSLFFAANNSSLLYYYKY